MQGHVFGCDYKGVRWSDLPQVKLTYVRDGVFYNMHMSGHADYNSRRPYIAVDTKRLRNYGRELSEEGRM